MKGSFYSVIFFSFMLVQKVSFAEKYDGKGAEVKFAYNMKNSLYPETSQMVFYFCLKNDLRENEDIPLALYHMIKKNQISNITTYGNAKGGSWYMYEISVTNDFLSNQGNINMLYPIKSDLGLGLSIDIKKLLGNDNILDFYLDYSPTDCGRIKFMDQVKGVRVFEE